MLTQFSYPIICTDKFSATVAFYEDHFEFRPALEMDGFVILKREDWPDMHLAVIDVHHKAIPEAYRKPVQGMILNFPVHNVEAAYQELYWEGLKINGKPEDALCGRKHFFVEDPNGILVDVAQGLALDDVMSIDKIRKLCHVAAE